MGESWWERDFATRLPAEQARMKRELPDVVVQELLERELALEERELRGEATARCEVVARKDEHGEAEG